MFTEGLDEKAISWIKQGSELDRLPRSPLIEKSPLDPISNVQGIHRSGTFLSPKALPPIKFHSGLLGTQPNFYDDSEDEVESVDSVPEGFYAHFSDTFEEDGPMSSDSDLFGKLKDLDDEMKSKSEFSNGSERALPNTDHRGLARGFSKENLRVEVAVDVKCRDNEPVAVGSSDRNSMTGAAFIHNYESTGFSSSMGHLYNEYMTPNFQELGTPSAPPIVGTEREETKLDVEDAVKETLGSVKFSSKGPQSQDVNALPTGTLSGEQNVSMPCLQTNSAEQLPCYTTSAQSAWQTFVAYDACFRLCLNAWTRHCMEAPEFLQDECMALRGAFGIQKYLLQPRGLIQGEGKAVDSTEGTSTSSMLNGRKPLEIEVEVKRVRMIPTRRKLQATSSQRALSIQVGADYVRHVTTTLKRHVNSLTSNSLPIAPEEAFSCKLQLKSSAKDALTDTVSVLFLKPGSGDSHIFNPENQSDAVLLEILDINKVKQGQATIEISSLPDSHGEIIKWWPIYLEGHECVGKVQLLISSAGTSKINPAKGGPVVETLVYDLVLDAAMRAQNIRRRNLHINGAWRWLLNEFADYYGVSDAYTKLRYMSSIMKNATPTRDCLELLYELLLPVIKARGEKSLTRQERSILLDCEDQINKLIATVFENYKALDEFSPSGLTDFFGPIPESAAPALIPAVQVFTLLHDILSHESQNLLRNYLLTACAKRCRRHMLETEEFMPNNCDEFLTDSMTISTAYLKMKMLCLNITSEIQADIKIHNQHILPSSIDLPKISAALYSTQLCKRLRGFLAACPPSKPSPHVTELLIATVDLERNLDSWNISPAHGGLVSKDLFHNYIMVWVEDTRLQLLDISKAEKVPISGITTHCATSPFVENIYEQIIHNLIEYEVVINRWPQYCLSLESAVADVERAIMKALEKQYNDILMPLKDGIPKMLEKQVQKFTRRQSGSSYVIPNELGVFLNTVKRILDVLHCKVEDVLKSWATYLSIDNGSPAFGEQMNGVTVMLRKKYKQYMQAIVEKLSSNMQANRNTRLKRILEEIKYTEGESEIREKMQALCLQLGDSIRNVHSVFSSRIFIAICRGFWDRMGQIVLSFLESRKENRIWYRGSDYALGILDDLFASEIQTLQGNSLQDKDLDPPQSVVEARSILC